jgi:UDP-4-amino-4-deoxy-L-arabinose formyltransferase/UDP-glucuronic acid dehydrogenase (UDP-4-keto-hexauronic acid decarboxylating)
MKAVVFAYHNMGIAGLDALFNHGFDIEAIFTHEDDPDENCWFGSVKNWAQQKNITVYTTEEVNSPQWIAKIAAFDPDIIFSFYYRKMICREILDLPRIGAFNLHGSFLPDYRGRCPVNWVIINGEKQTGVTLHYMIDKPDAGDIVGQKAVVIDLSDTAKTLYDKLCRAAQELLDKLLPLIKGDQIPRQKQDLKAGSYYGGRRPEDGRIDWKKSAGEIYNLIRGVTRPYPGAFALMENNEKIIIWWAEPQEWNKSAAAGDVGIRSQDVLVQTGENAIKLLEIEIPGKYFTDSQIVKYFRQGKVTKLI